MRKTCVKCNVTTDDHNQDQVVYAVANGNSETQMPVSMLQGKMETNKHLYAECRITRHLDC